MEFMKDKTKYTLITTIGNYTILKRETSFEPYITAYNFSFWEEGNEYVWGQGHYYDTQEEALLYAIYNTVPGASVIINRFSGIKEIKMTEEDVA